LDDLSSLGGAEWDIGGSAEPSPDAASLAAASGPVAAPPPGPPPEAAAPRRGGRGGGGIGGGSVTARGRLEGGRSERSEPRDAMGLEGVETAWVRKLVKV
jgi:hypothetical protein